MTRRPDLRDEGGFAMMTALAIAVVVSLLSVVAAAVGMHNVQSSATNRERVQAIAAAEAGINRMYAHLETATAATVSCSITEELTNDPNSSFVATLWVPSGSNVTPMTCPPASLPPQILIRSIGSGVGPVPERTMESLVNVIPNPGAMFGPGAIFSDKDLLLDSNVTVNGFQANDADIYSNDSIHIFSNSIDAGSAYAQDEILMNSNADVRGDVWARNRVEMDSNSVVHGNVQSSTSSVTTKSNAHIFGNARAGTTVSQQGGTIDGAKIQNSPSGPPPVRPFPTYTYDAPSWQALGYTINTFTSCTTARTFIQGIASGNHVVRINSTCALSWTGNSTVNVRGNLAIVHNGSFLLDSNARLLSVGGPHQLHLLVGLASGSCSSSKEFRMSSNAAIGSNLKTLIYSPCDAHFNSNAIIIKGQVFAGQAHWNSNVSLSYEPIGGPSAVANGNAVEPLYTREISGL